MKAIGIWTAVGIAAAAIIGQSAVAGPYSSALENTNTGAPDAGIAGFVGPAGEGVTATSTNGNYVNPVFKGWATGYTAYDPFGLASIQTYMSGNFAHPEKTLGPVTGNNFDIASLGDMTTSEITAWQTDPAANHGPGYITLTFANSITNGSGADFAVFENAFISAGGAGVAGQVFAELGYVEVSTNGVDFARFPSVSLTSALVGAYGTVDPTNVYNLVGKHVNAYGNSWGTPFNLDDLTSDPLVTSGLVDLNDINYVKIVDIPGDGSFKDSLGNPIYDAWRTWGSGGVDLEAIGVINQVPEPSTILLMAGGLLGLLFYTWLKRRRSAKNSDCFVAVARQNNELLADQSLRRRLDHGDSVSEQLSA
jgi:hypothetical protein